ncbi:MAG: LPS export ABC transporter ATP-binding protein [Veillonellaceae bacterium]|nr:LPS export ABC transporter ATP-binding protein [Veillonellaceae bacterium]
MYIEAQELRKSYRERTVVDGVSIRVERGQAVGLLGPNGAGKTTTFYMIVGIIRPDSGTILADGRDITREAVHRRAMYGIGYLPQEASVFRKLSVRDNIAAILETRRDLDEVQRAERLQELLRDFSLEHVAERQGSALSGGERRRTEIARCLATDPKFILLDEPFAGVDPIAVADIQAVITQLKERNIGVLITDHNVRETLSIVDRAYILNEGKILLEGDAQTIANDPLARKFYLGDSFRL